MKGEKMKKTYFNLEGRAMEDVKEEILYLFIEMRRLAKLKKDSFEYAAISYDIKDKMQGFKNFFSQDIDTILNTMDVSTDEI